MKKLLLVLLLFLCFGNIGFSQGVFKIQNKKHSDKVKFKLINNLMIIPVEINGVELSFLLDTGVSKPIIFNILNISDSLKIKNTETIFLRGLGQGESVEALKSKNNIFRVGEAININQNIYAVYDSSLNFAPRLGVPVHGIIGFDLFKDFIVEINYASKYIKLSDPLFYEYKKCRKCERFNLEFYNNKPYLNAEVSMASAKVPVKLLIDSGGSDSVWLFEDEELGIKSNRKSFDDFLGHGLSGSVYGKRSIIDEFRLKSFAFKNANVAYPDSSSISFAKQFKNRNGSIAGNILKRFNIIIDYHNAIITFKKNGRFNERFSYNNSGIELAHTGVRMVKSKDHSSVFVNQIDEANQASSTNGSRIVLDTRYKIILAPAYAIVALRENSTASRAGLKLGDIIVEVNGSGIHNYSLQQIMHFFYEEDGKRVRLRVDRGGKFMNFSFYLESPIK